MKNIYVLVKFELNEGIDISEWKGMSDEINKDIAWADGLQFRDSGVDEKGNVYCILKWDSLEQQVTFRALMDKQFEANPEIMKEFGRIVDMDTMTMDKITLL